MATNAKKGNVFLLKIADKWNSSVYTTVAAMRSNGMTINNTMVDITNKSSLGWQESLPGGGLKSVALTASGIYVGDVTQATLLKAMISQISASGSITFPANPAASNTIILNGVTWTFVASGATGNQTNIGANLAATLTTLATNLNASANTVINKATYVATATELLITFDAVGQDGNLYTLGAGVGTKTVSGPTLSGGRNNDTHWNYQMVDGVGSTWTGQFHIESYTRTGEVNEVDTFEISLTSTGAVVFVPGA